jgi:hypothetical protein
MAAICAFVVATNTENVTAGNYRVLLDVLVNGQTPTDPYRCELEIPFSDTSAQANAAIEAAAVTEAESHGFTVGLSNRTVLAGAVGL